MYTLAVVDTEEHVAHAVLANFIILVLFNLKNISNTTKVKLYETVVVPIVLYGSERRCLRKKNEERILVAEMEIVAGDKV